MVSLDSQHDMASVLDENERLKRRAERQTAIIRLLVVLLKLSGFRLDEQRLPDGTAKARVLRAVDRCKGALSLKSTLRLVRLSPARYHAWKRAEKRCELDDRSSCPRSHPTQLTPAEVSTIEDMVTATAYRHMPLRTLTLYAQRAGQVDQLIANGLLHRVLAQVEVSFSNSMIEAFWRSLRHQWLYLHSLDSFTQLEQLIDFYIGEHNTQMPHNAFGGHTPDEVYLDQADRVRDRLTAARHQARRARMEANRGESCGVCALPIQQSMSVISAVANAPP